MPINEHPHSGHRTQLWSVCARLGAACIAACLAAGTALGAVATTDAEQLPIREITAFKDGHALVLRSGAAPTNDAGDVVLHELPRPILGTFWLDSNESHATVAAVRSERMMVDRERDAATIADLLRANVGSEIIFAAGRSEDLRRGVLVDVVERRRSSNDDDSSTFWNGVRWVTTRASGQQEAAERIALVREREVGGELFTAAIPLGDLRDVRFADQPERAFRETIEDERLTIDLSWKQQQAEANADISLMYVERGLRWIPQYRITMLSGDRVRIELQAALVNELADLNKATVHLAIGAPSFAFDHTPDPMAMRDNLRDLGFFFREASDNATGSMLNRALMSQRARQTEVMRSQTEMADQGGADPAMGVIDSERREDLYVFTMSNVTLKKGGRLVAPVVSYEAPVESVYTLSLPASPPIEAARRFNLDDQRRIARLLDRPTPRHVLRIENTNDAGHPITTAPALVVKDGVTLAQGLITYTPAGATVDLEVGAAVDISVDTDEEEIGRDIRGLRWNGDDYARADIDFDATLTNRKPHAVTLEVTKLAFGNPNAVSGEGDARALSLFDADNVLSVRGRPWWNNYAWPWYWNRLNGAAAYTWTIELDPGEERTLEASWHYFWR